MEVYTLEEEGMDNMFLTQSSQNILPLVPNFDVQHDMGNETVMLSQTENCDSNNYSDISDEEDVNIPCSQAQVDHTYDW